MFSKLYRTGRSFCRRYTFLSVSYGHVCGATLFLRTRFGIQTLKPMFLVFTKVENLFLVINISKLIIVSIFLGGRISRSGDPFYQLRKFKDRFSACRSSVCELLY